MCGCHRANSSVERRLEIGNRSTPNRSLGNNGADGREGVLHTMVQLGDQHALAFLCALALSYQMVAVAPAGHQPKKAAERNAGPLLPPRALQQKKPGHRARQLAAAIAEPSDAGVANLTRPSVR
jgi:hypothetical protein